MTDQEVRTLTGKVDKLFGVTSELQKDVAVLVAKFDGYVDSQEGLAEIREETCPQAQTLHRLSADVDAVAGTVRTQGKDIEELQGTVEAIDDRHLEENVLRRIWGGGGKELVTITTAVITALIVHNMLG